MTARHRLAWLITAVTLVACGGGGGNGGGGGGNPPPPPAPPLPQIAITDGNARETVVVGSALIEGTLQLTSLASQLIAAVAADPTAPATACSNGSTISYSFTDNDQDGALSPGDDIRATLNNCETVDLNATASGDILLTLNTPAQQSGPEDQYYSGQIDASSLTINGPSGSSVTIRGRFSFSVDFEVFTEVIRAGGSVDFSITSNGQTVTESLRNFSIEKVSLFDEARYRIGAEGEIRSELLDGTVTYDSVSLSGFLNTLPNEGQIRLVGASSYAAAAAGVDADSRIAVIEYQAASGGVASLPVRPGWTELLEGFVWWYREESPDRYVFRDVRPDEFTLISQNVERLTTVGVNPVFIAQFSRPVDPASLPPDIFIQKIEANPSFNQDLPIAADLRGARLVGRPVQQLIHDAYYVYPVPTLRLESLSGNVEFVTSTDFFTDDSLSSLPQGSDRFGVSGVTVTLDATRSEAVGSSIASYLWQQTGGTPGLIGNAAQPITTFAVPQVTGAEVLTLDLQVTNAEGEFDSAELPFAAFGSVGDIRVLNYYGETGDPIGRGRELLLTSANSNLFIARVDVPNYIDVYVLTTPELGNSWRVQFGGPDETLPQVGFYENAVDNPGPGQPLLDVGGNGVGCTSTGRFEVLEISYDANNELLGAAVDFEAQCPSATGRLLGSIRVGSDIPIPEPPQP